MDNGLIVALIVGAIGGGGITSWITSYFSFRNKRKEERLRQFGQLHILSNKYFTNLSAHFMHCYPLLKGKINYNQYLDLIIEGGKTQTESPHYELEMFVDIHFPRLKPYFHEVLLSRDKITTLMSKMKYTYSQGDNIEIYYDEFHESFQNLNLAQNRYFEELAKQARQK